MPFLHNCPEFWGPWNHASLTSLAKKNAEIKIGIRQGFSLKGILSLKKNYNLNLVKRKETFREPGTAGILLGNLLGWMWLRSSIYPKYLKFLDPYKISHPRPIGKSFSDFCWEELVRMGQWTLHQGDIQVKHKSTILHFKWKIQEGDVYGKANRIKGKGKLQLEMINTSLVMFPEPKQELQENFYNIKVFEEEILFSTNLSASPEEIERRIEVKEKLPSSNGSIKDCVEALLTIIGVNSLKTPDHGWLTSLMRRAGVAYNGWTNFMWDNSFIGMMSALHYPQLATGNIDSVCMELTNRGFFPNQSNPVARAETLTQLPVTSYCALKVGKILNVSMEQVLQNLVKNNEFWLKNRDPNGFHLLSYGSELKHKCAAALRQQAKYESGMDNHPMFDGVPMDYESGCMAMYSVCLNSVYALDCLSLSELARMNGNQTLSKKYQIRYENMKRVINSFLWDGETYRNRYWNGDFQDEIHANFLLPLIAGIPPPEQAKSTVDTVLKSCLTPFGIAPSPMDHPAFKDQLTWRGRLLPPMQFLVSEALRRYEFDLEASDLARRCYRCFHEEWSEESHFHESYNGFTGDGDDVSITGEPNHPWAGLFPYLSIQDFVDYEPWNGIRLGRLKPINATISDIPIRGNTYSVELKGNEQIIKKNSKTILSSNQPILLRSFLFDSKTISFKSKALKSLTLSINLPQNQYVIELNGQQFKENVDNSGLLRLEMSDLENIVKITKT